MSAPSTLRADDRQRRVIRPGDEWGSPASSPPDLVTGGDDAALATAVAGAPGALIRFEPDPASDLARAVGLRAGDVVGTEVPLDALVLGDGTLVCNMCIFGTPPDRLRWSSPAPEVEIVLDGRPWFEGRASTVVVAIGQFLRGLDLVPRGHPGDAKAEVQVYGLERRERRRMRTRLASGSHLPHPNIRQRSARTIDIRFSGSVPCELDGVAGAAVTELTIRVVAAAYRLLI